MTAYIHTNTITHVISTGWEIWKFTNISSKVFISDICQFHVPRNGRTKINLAKFTRILHYLATAVANNTGRANRRDGNEWKYFV